MNNVSRGRKKFVIYKILLGLDAETNKALINLANATDRSPNDAARFAIRAMAKAYQVDTTPQGETEDPSQKVPVL